MKNTLHIIPRTSYIVIVLLVAMLTLGLGTTQARKQPVPKMYLFGMAASFQDTIVHFTPIQELDSTWIESKNGFLQDRQAYSYQLRDYLERQQMPNRTCIVFYSQKREKLEKKYQKMLRLYTKSKDGLQHFDIRHLVPQEFSFYTVQSVADEEVANE